MMHVLELLALFIINGGAIAKGHTGRSIGYRVLGYCAGQAAIRPRSFQECMAQFSSTSDTKANGKIGQCTL